MKIWLINTGEEVPSDPGKPRLLRTGILARHLVDRGHKVTWWNATVNHQRKVQRAGASQIKDTAEGYRLVLLFGRLYDRNISLARILSQIENAGQFRKLAPLQPRPDVILCGYPTIELAAAATRFALSNDIPIAIDFRDMWPDMIERQVPRMAAWLAQPLLRHWYSSQRAIVRQATAIVGITEAFVDWALAKATRPRGPLDRAFHLAVDPVPPGASDKAEAVRMWDALDIREDSGKLIGCFAGTLSTRLDVLTITKAATLLTTEERQQIQLVLCGSGELERDLRHIAKGESSILFPGWRNAAELYVLLRRSRFGLLPYPSTKDFQMSFPNKVGEYLSTGLPIMTGLKGITQTLLRERDLGFFYEEGNPESAAACLREILANPDAACEKADGARAAFHEFFDPNRIYPAFCDYLEELSRQKARPASPRPL